MLHVIEFNLLFPEKIITRVIIHEWIGYYISRTTIQNILAQYMKQEKKNRIRDIPLNNTLKQKQSFSDNIISNIIYITIFCYKQINFIFGALLVTVRAP